MNVDIESGEFYTVFHKAVGGFNHVITISTFDSGWQVVHTDTALEIVKGKRGKPRKVGSVRHEVFYWSKLEQAVSCALGEVIKLGAKGEGLDDIYGVIHRATNEIIGTLEKMRENG